ncbi:MAG: (Fe-S)-binding protein [Deltaproteobacteria bacterium]|nr:(Fe-S)-binding protein [Deltaproteobacteria bacterium]
MLGDLKTYTEWMDKCSHCAFCEATCPVYLADLLETHVARSRMMVIRESLLNNTLPQSKRVHEIINRCLLCSNCTQTCPASIPVDEIVIAARYRLYGGKRMQLPKRILLKRFMEKRGVTGAMRKLEGLARTAGIIPKEIPTSSKKAFEDRYAGTYEPTGEVRAKAVYFVGCATNTLYPDTGDAVMKVLAQNGITVTVPDGLVCCGIPALAEGDIKTARQMMESNLNILAAIESDVILTDCTSCGMTLKEKLSKLFPRDDSLYEKATAVSAKIKEVTDYLVEVGLTTDPTEPIAPFTYHIPCHGAWTPGLNDAPRKILLKIPNARMVEMEEPEKCCGAGGTFFTEFKSLSETIRNPKIEDIQNTGVKTVVTQCPSCRSYLNSALADIDVIHPMAMLARAYGFKSE